MWPTLYQTVLAAPLKIDGIKVWAVMKGFGDFPFQGQAKLVIKTNGVEDETALINLGRLMVWTTYSNEWALNPITAEPWTEAEVAALQAGVDLAGDWRGGFRKFSYCTQLYVEVSIGGVAKVLRPNAAGDKCLINGQVGDACPNHWKNVDEDPSDDDTTYVWAGIFPNSGWYMDLYNLQDLSEV